MKKLISISIQLVILTLFHSCNSKGGSSVISEQNLPNIILILSDDQAWDDYSFMGHESIETPNIDRLARQGMTFTRGYVPTSLCRPSLATMVTGLYPHQHSVLGNDPVIPDREKYNWGNDFLIKRAEKNRAIIENFEGLKTIPDFLKERGYVSFQSGKWWEGNYRKGGFDFGMTHGDPARGGRHGDEGLKIGREGMDTVFNFIDYAVSEDQSFFLWYAPFLPHTPHNPPDTLFNKYLAVAPTPAVAAYWANCEWFDITCGQLLDYVDSKGINENTLIIYVCDNGWVQDPDQRNRYAEAEPSKRSPYENGIRTPIMFKWDGTIEPVMNTETLVSSIDILPAILDLAGVDKPENMHGISVFDEKTLRSRKAIFGEIYAHDFTTIDASLYYRIVISDQYKLILPDGVNKPGEKMKLFQILEDPSEAVDIANEEPQVAAALMDLLDQFWSEI